MNKDFQVSQRLVLINTLASFFVRILSVFVLIWLQQFLLENISVEEYSLLPVVVSLMVFFPVFTAVFTTGVKRRVMIAFVNGRPDDISRVVTSIFPVLVAVAVFIFSIGLMFSRYVDSIINVDPLYIDVASSLILILILSESVKIPFEAFSSGLYCKQKFVLINIVMVFSEIIRFGSLFLLLSIDLSIESVVISNLIGNLTQTVVTFYLSIRELPEQRLRVRNFDINMIKELSNFGGWSALHGVAGMVRKTSDAFILNRFASPLDVTCFHLGSLLTSRLDVIINQSFLGSITPVIQGLAAQNDDVRLKRIYLKTGRYALWGVLSLLPFFIVYKDSIINLYVGNEFNSAATVLVFLLLCYPFYYGNILYRALADARGEMKSLAIREIIATVLKIGLALIMVGYFNLGAMGAAVSTFSIFGIGSVFIYWPLGKRLAGVDGSQVFKEIITPGVLPFVISFFFTNGISLVLEMNDWFGFIIIGGLSFAFHLLMILPFLREDDRGRLGSMLEKLRFRFSC